MGKLKIDKDLIIVFLLVAITGFILFFVFNQRAFLNFFYVPVIIGAYFMGKRYATQAAFLSFLIIFLVAYVYPTSFRLESSSDLYRWLDLMTWGGFLVLTGYLMGVLYEKKEKTALELRNTYTGIIEMLSALIDSVDKQTQSHSYRVSMIAEKIARQLRCPEIEIEDIRIAALLHDIGKLGISSDILKKAGTLTDEESRTMRSHTRRVSDFLSPTGGRVLQLLPLIVYHHEKYDGSGYEGLTADDIPFGAKIIAVADVYEALTADRPYRKAMTPFEARKEIVDNAGVQFDPAVVSAFEKIFPSLLREGPMFPSSTSGRVALGY
ncbi:MAG: HD-GYP domain-containing protein [Nitrospirota bacterium]|jgi:putative nucleotidyltransferase with HDIG domain